MVTLKPRKRLSSGEQELDTMMGGGFIEGSANLISGAQVLEKQRWACNISARA